MDNRVTPNLIETKNYRKKKDPKKRTLAIVAGALAASVLVMGVYFIAKPHEHGFSPWQMVLEPTCESEGERERVCAGCDFHEIEVIPPAGHTEVTELGYAPTATENGLSDRIYCSACDKVLQEHTVIKATGSEGLEYREETGVIIITGLGTCKDTYLVVPAEIDGVPVTTINANAFEGGTFKSVSIPQSVGMIGAEAFKDCKSLESITIPEKVRYIYDDTFNGCTKLSRVTIPDTIEYIGQNAFYGCANLHSIAKEGQTGAVIRVEEIKPYTFYGCTSLTSINLGSTRVIGESAFEGCTSLANITWYEGVEFINANAFRGIAATDVSIPKSVIGINNGAFADCESLININFSGTMEEWHSMGRSSDWKNADIHINCTDGTAEHIKTTIEGVPPTDTENGLSNGIVCNICGEVLEEQKVIHAGSQGLYYNVNEDGETCTVMDINMFEGTELIVPQYIDGYRVTAIGSQAFKGCAHLTSVVIPEGVTMIGSSAFADCTSLENVALPESLTFIDTFAFNSCTELRTIVLPEKLEVINGSAFKRSGITSIEIPASVKSIGSEAFYYCESLENVTLHDGLETIGDSVFNGCASLKEITVPASVTEMGYSTFSSCTALESAHINANIEVLDGTFNSCESLATVTIPKGLKSIKFSTFSGCKSLTKVELPEGLLHIEGYAFQNCQNLEEADIPSSVTEIGERAFAFCRKLKSISVPAGVRVVGDYAFAYCNAVTTLTIASGVEEIGVNSFAGVSASEITIPATVKKIGSGAFSTVYADYFVYEGTVAEWSAIDKADDWYSGMEYMHIRCTDGTLGHKETVVPGKEPTKIHDGYTSHVYCALCGDVISESTVIPATWEESTGFEYTVLSDGTCAITGMGTCTDTEMIIPQAINGYTVSTIGEEAFYNNTSIEVVYIPDGVTKIEARAFYGCALLTEVHIPETVTSIGETAFYRCTALESITVPGSIYGLESNVFAECTALSSVTLCEGIKEIGGNAFDGCISLTEIYIPASVTSVNSLAFSNCSALTYIDVSDENLYLMDIDGVLVTSQSGRLIRYPAGRGNSYYEVPEGITKLDEWAFDGATTLKGVDLCDVTEIGQFAFNGCDSLTSVHGENIAKIDSYAFLDCASLESIVIPQTVTQMGAYVFDGCTALVRFEYRGTVADWEAMNKPSAWNAAFASSAPEYAVYCTDGTIAKDGTVTYI